MTKHRLLLLAAAAALTGCASMNTPAPEQSASLKPAILLVNSGSGGAGADRLAEASQDGQKAATVPGESKLMRIYWFLGGR